ncbi:MAG: class I SAM-dependent methyltransferase [Hyphomicrobiaceae bacterium]|nr:class I SAM-dependent methyltransferase [Caldilineaceae bacterium]MCB1515078.1 class I SAM-dependent methyltransferase [Hyphomicrobiaceae bacterium]MCC0008125.1 class I SAM-dependent methyltransferase [Hyphomicrobiaceae bacterium]
MAQAQVDKTAAPDWIGMMRQLAGNAMRVGWYAGVNRLGETLVGTAAQQGQSVHRTRPMPKRHELMAELRTLLRRDALLVRDGVAVADAANAAGGLPDHLARIGEMLADLKDAAGRRSQNMTTTAEEHVEADHVPDYFAQDFHFQKGGYLADESARLYDVQVETLFMGSAAAMRRAALRPIAEHVAGRDQRHLALLDVACGTGRLLREIRSQYPAMKLSGLDLSAAYLREAERHLHGLRRVELIAANAEAMPLPEASQDIVVSVFLFHELPGDVRRRVAGEMARVMKPGGRLIVIDSLQMGDRPSWDGMLEAFPQRFHEPYYPHYATDDLTTLFSGAGLVAVDASLAFLSKVMVFQKT